MIKSTHKQRATVLALAGLVAFTTERAALAQLIAYEGFDYPNGSWLGNTNTGGYGWAAAWATGSQVIATNTATGLNYGTLLTSGGAIVMGNPYGNFTGTQVAQRSLLGNGSGLTNLFGGSGGTIWISFLYQNWTDDPGGLSGYRQANISFFSGATTNANGTSNNNGTEKLDVGSPNTYQAPGDYMSLWGQGIGQAAAQQSMLATPRGETEDPVFILLQLTFDNTTAADTVYAWFNPDLSSYPNISTALSTNNIDLSSISAIRFQAGNHNASGTNAVMAVDELRVGYTAADVGIMPEPATVALAGLGGLFFLAGRRRRQ